LKRTLRLAILLSFVCGAVAAFSNNAQAQKVDLAFGISTVTAPSASSASGSYVPVSLTGGTFPGFSGDGIFWHHMGIGGEVYWRASQGSNYLDSGVNYRPLFWNFNAVYSPKLASHTYLELVGGIGALSTRFYCPQCGNGYNTNYQSSNHFDADFGGGIKFYPKGGFFVRPEARLYLVNNNIDYSAAHATRLGLSIGYTFGGR
jgi:hypothetical protein